MRDPSQRKFALDNKSCLKGVWGKLGEPLWRQLREPLNAARIETDCVGIGKLCTARSRLYRSQILQANTRWKALAEVYTMYSVALRCTAFGIHNRKPLSNLKFSLKIDTRISFMCATYERYSSYKSSIDFYLVMKI